MLSESQLDGVLIPSDGVRDSVIQSCAPGELAQLSFVLSVHRQECKGIASPEFLGLDFLYLFAPVEQSHKVFSVF